MRVLLIGFFILVLVVCKVLGDIGTCEEVSDCSEATRNKCDEMSHLLKESNQKLVLACKNGICMCNMEILENVQRSSQPKNQERKPEEKTEEVEIASGN